jgi:hypothetical protein
VKLFNEEIRQEDVEYLIEWLKDVRGRPFWKWIASESKNCHDRASAPVGQNPIRDVLLREGHLAQENAFDQVKSFAEIVEEQYLFEKERLKAK